MFKKIKQLNNPLAEKQRLLERSLYRLEKQKKKDLILKKKLAKRPAFTPRIKILKKDKNLKFKKFNYKYTITKYQQQTYLNKKKKFKYFKLFFFNLQKKYIFHTNYLFFSKLTLNIFFKKKILKSNFYYFKLNKLYNLILIKKKKYYFDLKKKIKLLLDKIIYFNINKLFINKLIISFYSLKKKYLKLKNQIKKVLRVILKNQKSIKRNILILQKLKIKNFFLEIKKRKFFLKKFIFHILKKNKILKNRKFFYIKKFNRRKLFKLLYKTKKFKYKKKSFKHITNLKIFFFYKTKKKNIFKYNLKYFQYTLYFFNLLWKYIYFFNLKRKKKKNKSLILKYFQIKPTNRNVFFTIYKYNSILKKSIILKKSTLGVPLRQFWNITKNRKKKYIYSLINYFIKNDKIIILLSHFTYFKTNPKLIYNLLKKLYFRISTLENIKFIITNSEPYNGCRPPKKARKKLRKKLLLKLKKKIKF